MEQTPEFSRDRYQALAHILGEGPEVPGGVADAEIQAQPARYPPEFIDPMLRVRTQFWCFSTGRLRYWGFRYLTIKNVDCFARKLNAL